MRYGNISFNITETIKQQPATVKETKELIQEYCSAIDYRITILLGVVLFMWLFEPKLKSILEKEIEHKETREFIIKIYKWIGIGLQFMAIFALIWV